MSDPNASFQPPPPPVTAPVVPTAPRPTKLRPVAFGLIGIGVALALAGILKFLPGGIGTGIFFAFWGILLIAFSFIPLPVTGGASEPPMSAIEKLAGIFYEPSRVFKNLRTHPYWLAPFLVIALASAVYSFAFVQRLTPERIVEHTMEKMQDSPIKPPADKMDEIKEANLQQAKQPIQRAQTFAKTFVNWFIGGAFFAALYMVATLAFGGRINFWQAFASTFYAFLPVIVITKVVSLIILFVKAPEDIHPILNADTLVQDNLGFFFAPAVHPALFVLGSAIGVLSFYGLWLRAKGLMNAGTKVSSGAAWGATLTLWIIFLLFGMAFATLFSSFLT
jgi:hypothetical protein